MDGQLGLFREYFVMDGLHFRWLKNIVMVALLGRNFVSTS